MSRIWTCGFEMRSGIELTATSLTGNWTLDWVTGRRAGTYAIRNQSSGNSGFAANWTKTLSVNPTEWYARFVIAPVGSSKTARIFFNGSTSGSILQIQVGGSATLTFLNNAGTTLGSTTSVLTGGWDLIEIYCLQHASAGILQVKFNGVLEINATGLNTQSTAVGGLGGVFVTTSTGIMGQYLDDFGINDTTGSDQNSWLGDGYIDFVAPNANGDSSNWVGSDGNSTDNYLLVDEVPHNADTDYVQSFTSTDKDLYNLTTITLATGEEFVLLQPVAVAKRIVLDTPIDMKVGIKSGSTEDFDAGRTLSTSYKAEFGDVYYYDPNTSLQWSQSAIDALQVGVQNG